MNSKDEDSKKILGQLDVNHMLEGALSVTVDHIAEDGSISENEIRMLIQMMERMGVAFSPELRAMVERYLQQELTEWRAEQEVSEKAQKEQQEQEELEEAQRDQWREQSRLEKLRVHDEEVSKIMEGLSSIVCGGAVGEIGKIVPSVGGVMSDDDNTGRNV